MLSLSWLLSHLLCAKTLCVPSALIHTIRMRIDYHAAMLLQASYCQSAQQRPLNDISTWFRRKIADRERAMATMPEFGHFPVTYTHERSRTLEIDQRCRQYAMTNFSCHKISRARVNCVPGTAYVHPFSRFLDHFVSLTSPQENRRRRGLAHRRHRQRCRRAHHGPVLYMGPQHRRRRTLHNLSHPEVRVACGD